MADTERLFQLLRLLPFHDAEFEAFAHATLDDMGPDDENAASFMRQSRQLHDELAERASLTRARIHRSHERIEVATGVIGAIGVKGGTGGA